MRILLIAGHGNGDCGAVGCGYKEADLTREMVKLITPKLLKYAVVDVADTKVNWYQHICQNGSKFNFKGYDYVLEVHFNACVKDTKGNGVTTGTEIYVTTSEKGTTVEQAIVDKISALGLKNRGVKRKNWSLINHIKKQGVSCALLETCFIDDADDMKVYINKKEQIANAVVEGIASGFGLKKAEEAKAVASELYKDVPKDHWAYEGIKYATEKGYMTGYSDKTFKPDQPVSRAEMAVILKRIKA